MHTKTSLLLSLGASLLLLTPTASVSADETQFLFGGYYWEQNEKGDFKINENDVRPIDVRDDLDYDQTNNAVFYLSFHPQGEGMPRFVLQHTMIKDNNRSFVQLEFTWNGVPFQLQENFFTEIDFSHTDLGLYWPLSAGRVDVEAGVTLRKFNGRVYIESLEPLGVLGRYFTNELEFNDLIPMVYIGASTDLPVQGLRISASINAMNYDNNEMLDFSASLDYRHHSGLGTHLGYRGAYLDIGDFAGIIADVQTYGPYLGIDFAF